MKRVFGVVLGALAVIARSAPAAHAATGRVVLSSAEITPLAALGDPACFALPVTVGKGCGSHVPSHGATVKA